MWCISHWIGSAVGRSKALNNGLLVVKRKAFWSDETGRNLNSSWEYQSDFDVTPLETSCLQETGTWQEVQVSIHEWTKIFFFHLLLQSSLLN